MLVRVRSCSAHIRTGRSPDASASVAANPWVLPVIASNLPPISGLQVPADHFCIQTAPTPVVSDPCQAAIGVPVLSSTNEGASMSELGTGVIGEARFTQ